MNERNLQISVTLSYDGTNINELYSEIKPLHDDSCLSVQGIGPNGRRNLIIVME
jgi:hypothetical protein